MMNNDDKNWQKLKFPVSSEKTYRKQLDALHEDILYKETLINNLVEALKRAGHEEGCPVLDGASWDCVPNTCPISKIPERRFNVGDNVWITVRDKFRRIRQGIVDYWSYNEMGEKTYAYYVAVGKRYSRYVCVDPYQYSRTVLSMNLIFKTEQEAMKNIVENHK